MDLELTDDQLELRDNIRTVLADASPPSLAREIHEGHGDHHQLWSTMVELGWPALGVPEADGGIGLGFVEVGLLAEELGRATSPGPLLATVSQFVPALIEFGAHDLLAEVAAGSATGSLALGEGSRWGRSQVATTVSGSDNRLNGCKSAVLSGAHVDHFVVVARDTSSGHLGLYIVDRAHAVIHEAGLIEPTLGLADVSFDDVPSRVLAPATADTSARIARVIDQAETAMALHVVGACRRIMEITLDYSKVRVQYDKVIGSFQALKHRFADMFLAVERANAAAYFAAVAIAEDDARRNEAAHLAKAAAGDCQALLVRDGLQLHGGIGFTWENDLHFWLKRAKAGEFLCGSSHHHRAELAASLGLIPEVAQ